MQRDDFTCVECGQKDATLNVHHRYYKSGNKPWQYPSWAMLTLCESCHKAKHSKEPLAEDEDPSEMEEWERMVEFVFGDSIEGYEKWEFAADIAISRGYKKSK